MSFWKHVKRVVRASYNPKTAMKMASNPKYALGLDKGGSGNPQDAAAAGEDPQTGLNNELANYKDIDNQAMTGATTTARTAGTYADTPAFQTQLKGEADAGARFGKRASLAKINAYQKQLGLPETPAGSI